MACILSFYVPSVQQLKIQGHTTYSTSNILAQSIFGLRRDFPFAN